MSPDTVREDRSLLVPDLPADGGAREGALVVLLPVFDDWDAVRELIPRLDDALAASQTVGRIVLLDDGSPTPCPRDLIGRHLGAIDRVEVLPLRRNLGHQRAICIGIAAMAVDQSLAAESALIIMDADGEDDPDDVPRLLAMYRQTLGQRVVFARRTRRSEGVTFRVFYALYRQLHRVLTGIPVQIGNFSVLPLQMARRLGVVSELWNHYAAAVVHSRLPIAMVDAPRGTRLHGRSRMNFVSLVSHGISAMSVFGERIGVRALVATIALMVVLLAGIAAVFAIRFLTPFAIPGWATTAAGVIALLLMQSLLLSVIFAFLVHLGRAGGGFLPARDYTWYVDDIQCVWSVHDRL